MRITLFVTVLLLSLPVQAQKKTGALVPVTDDPKLPRVLLIGDSISIGYTLPTREFLKGKANLHRIPANGGPTTRGLASIDAWIGESKWDNIAGGTPWLPYTCDTEALRRSCAMYSD